MKYKLGVVFCLGIALFFGTEKLFAIENAADGCNQDIWKYVYKPKRLKIIESCMMVSGVVGEVKMEGDGDLHIHIVPDEPYRPLLNEANIKKIKGMLVVEAVCARAPFPFVTGVCANCPYRFTRPKRGDRIRVCGSYVHDTKHGWMEIHPLMKLELLKEANADKTPH